MMGSWMWAKRDQKNNHYNKYNNNSFLANDTTTETRHKNELYDIAEEQS